MYFSATAFNNDCISAQKNAKHGNKAARMSYSVSTLTLNFWQIVLNGDSQMTMLHTLYPVHTYIRQNLILSVDKLTLTNENKDEN